MNLLRELLVKSWDGQYESVTDVVVSYLKNNTTADEIVLQPVAEGKANIIARFGNPSLVINGHLDTVPPAGNWNTDPHELIAADDRYIGLGTCDTKGSISVLLESVAKIKPNNLLLLFSVDEEAGGDPGVRTFIPSDYATGIKHALVMEPTNCQFVSGHLGYYSFFIRVRTSPEHSSVSTNNQNGNAVVNAARLIEPLYTAGFNIGQIAGGLRGNIVADFCQFKISKRTNQTHSEILNEVKTFLKNNHNTEIVSSFVGTPLVPPSGPMPFATDTMIQVKFWTEASLFRDAGIDAVVFGAGSIEQAHKQNEYCLYSQLEQARNIFERILVGL